MENINHKEKAINNWKYRFFLKSFLIFAILTASPQWYWMRTQDKNTNYSKIEEINIEIEHEDSKKIIEDAIRGVLFDLKTLDQLPKPIQYQIKTDHKLPQSIDILPKKIKEPIKWIIVVLGARKFFIEPLFWKVTKIELTKYSLIFETTYINKEYSKEYKLPTLCYRLWNTQEWKWEKSWFIGTTVTEI